MSDATNQLIFRLFISGLIGAVVGLEREKNMQITKEHNPLGIRTNILVGFLGGLSIYLSNVVSIWIFPMCLMAVIFLGFMPIIQNHFATKVLSYKSTVSTILVFLLGALAASGEVQVALALGIIITFVLSLKYTLHEIIYNISYPEIIDGAIFIIIAFVILPFLPNKSFDAQALSYFDPNAIMYTATNILNPYNIWFLIVIISGLNLLGYILVKLFGKHKAFGLTGFIGGFYSSTVTSLNLAVKSKSHTDIKFPFVAGILLACGTSFLKMFVLIRTLNADLFDRLFPGMAIMCVYLLCAGFIFHIIAQRQPKDDNKEESKTRKPKQMLEIESPLKLRSAIKLAFFVILTMLAANLILQYANINLYYLLAGLMAFFAVDDPVIISTASIAGKSISFDIAKNIILGVIFLNFLQKIATVYVFGNRKLLKPLAIGFSGLFLVTLLSFLYL